VGWWPRLLPHQVDLLRRIGEGRDPVTARESRLATTVYALRGRRLVTTPRSGGVWTAVITDAGRYYLEHGYYIDSPPPASRRGSVTAVKPSRVPERLPGEGSRGDPSGVPVAADELIQRLWEHGSVTVNDPPLEVRAAWRRVIDATKRQGLVPDGFRLRHRGRDHGDLVIELIDGDHPGNTSWNGERHRVVVPDDLDIACALVQDLQSDPARLQVSPATLPRALRVVQALVGEAERRGNEMLLADGDEGIVLVVRGRRYRLVMAEEWETIDHLPGAQESDPVGAYSWQRVQPQARTQPSGRLTLELTDDSYRWRGRPRRWADRRRWRLDDKLGDVLSEVEARATIDEQADLAAERARVERQRQWERAMDHARAQHVDAYYVASLKEQVVRWDLARAARVYVAAIEEATGSVGMGEDLRRWVDWIKQYADRIDPLTAQLQPPPPPPDPGPDDLRPFLGRWSPYGPDSHY
jgi:hypothetical protein